VAKIGAAFLCVRAGVTAEPREDHAHYLKCWIAVLKVDNRAIYTAARQAHVSRQAPYPLAKGVDARHPISADDIDQARERLIQTWEAFTIVEVSQELVEAAGRFADGFALRGYDRMQLAAAYQLNATTKQSLTFASYDRCPASTRLAGSHGGKLGPGITFVGR